MIKCLQTNILCYKYFKNKFHDQYFLNILKINPFIVKLNNKKDLQKINQAVKLNPYCI